MTAPKKPYRFANAETVYPAGANPWNSQPIRTAPAVDYLTPGAAAPPTAQGLNYVLGAATDALTDLWGVVAVHPVQNWKGNVNVTLAPISRSQWKNVVWDPTDNTWTAGVRTVGTPDVLELMKSYDGGRTWISVVTSTGVFPPSGNTADLMGLYYYSGNSFFAVCNIGTGTPEHAICLVSTTGVGTWSILHTFTANVNTGYGADFALFNGVYIATCGGASVGSGTSSGLYTSTNTVTWTAQTIPNTVGALAGIVRSWSKSAQSASRWLVLPRTVNGQGYLTSTDGVTFSSQAFGAGQVAATDTPEALAYGPGAGGNGLFMAAIGLTAGVGTRFLTSADGITWSVASSVTSQTVSDLVSFGSVWVASCDPQAGGDSAFVIYSVDDGVHWQLASALLGGNIASTGTLGYTRARIFASPAGLILQNTNNLDASFEAGGLGTYIS